MFCPKCAAPNLDDAAYCRACGHQIADKPDATRLTGLAVAKFIIGDAFVLPAVLLVALESSIQNVLWVLLSIPGLLLYTWAIADIMKARAIKKGAEQTDNVGKPRELSPRAAPEMPFDFTDRKTPISVTGRTTGDLGNASRPTQ